MRWGPRAHVGGELADHASPDLPGERHLRRLVLVSKFYKDANLYAPAPPYSGKGRPRVKGDKVATPEQVAEAQMRAGGDGLGEFDGG